MICGKNKRESSDEKMSFLILNGSFFKGKYQEDIKDRGMIYQKRGKKISKMS